MWTMSIIKTHKFSDTPSARRRPRSHTATAACSLDGILVKTQITADGLWLIFILDGFLQHPAMPRLHNQPEVDREPKVIQI